MLSALTNYINDNFGSKKGALNYVKFKMLLLLGHYKKYQKIDFAKVDRLIFICSGNICRSCFAEYVAKHFGKRAESFGLHCRGGDPADPRARDYAKSVGLDMTNHITRNIKDYQPGESDLLIVMEPKHIEGLPAELQAKCQLTIATLWADPTSAYLHDPYSSSLNFFKQCESRLWQATRELTENV